MQLKFTNRFLFLCLCLSLQLGVTAQRLQVTINTKGAKSYPGVSPMYFTVVFSSAINVASFTASTIVLSGTATGMVVNSINEVAPNNGTTFEVSVTATSATGTVIATIPAVSFTASILGTTGSDPTYLILDGSGNVYTSNESNNVSKVTPTGTSTILGTTGSDPQCITIDAVGNVYTSNGNSNNVSKITPAGVTSILGTTGNSPYALTIDRSGNIYTANNSNKSVSKITSEGVSTVQFGTTGLYPNAIKVDTLGNIYTANGGDNTLSKITPAGVSTAVFSTTGSSPNSLTIDGAGNIYTANSGDSTISMITPAGVSTKFATLTTSPTDITMDGTGNLYTANYSTSNVCKITPSGISSIIGKTGNGPTGIVIDGSGNLYTNNYLGNSVSKLTPSAGIALAGSSIPSNEASTTSTTNTYVLPIGLLFFKAVTNSCTASVSWQSTYELNSSYYSIEKSLEGLTFSELIKMPSKKSATGATYIYSCDLGSGTTYFRLKMVDNDGNYTYSSICTATSNGNCSAISVKALPNPTTGILNIKGLLIGDVVSLYEMSGRKITTTLAIGTDLNINMVKYAPGTYILLVQAADGSTSTVKVIKQ